MSEQVVSQGKSDARRRGLGRIALVVVLGAVAWGTWHWFEGRHFQDTDNAYVAGNVVQITPQVAGTVVMIQAEDTDFVRAGQVLVKLDAADAKLAFDQSRAQLGQTVREVRSLFANNATFKAQVSAREAELRRARIEAGRAQEDLSRRKPLVDIGAVGKEEFQHVQAQLAASQSLVSAAESAVLAAREQLLASQTQTEGTSVEQHPNVQRAAARVRETWLALQRMDLRAPLDGYVARRGVQIGQRVQSGTPMMTVVALNELWVDANFKESQLQKLRMGQRAELYADVYGRKVTYHGTITGLGAGTGAAFALLPAQNATGNWIKVVQRVPVRIALDPKELAANPLRVGLSMEVIVDVSAQEGKLLSDTPRQNASASTRVFEAGTQAVDLEISRIIADNLGRKRNVQ